MLANLKIAGRLWLGQILEAAKELSQQSAALKGVVDRFLADVRSA